MDINTYNSNGVSITPLEAVQTSKQLRPFVCGHIHNDWRNIFNERNSDYGTNTWVDLGLRGLYGLLYSKWQRIFNNPRNWDAIVDVYGYYVLAFIYVKSLGVHMQWVGCLENTTTIEELLEEGQYYLWQCDEINLTYACQWMNSMATFLQEYCWESHRE